MTMRAKCWVAGIGIPVLLIVLLAIFWSWNWFIPMVDSRASAALGRKVTMSHLRVRLGRVVTVRAGNVQIDNPKGFPATQPFAKIRQLTIRFNIIDYLFHNRTVVPLIDLNHPVINAVATPAQVDNYTFKATKPSKPGKPKPPPEIGTLTIESGLAHVVDPKLKANLRLVIDTRAATGIVAKHRQAHEIAVQAKGTYNNQPVTGTMIAGTLLTLRNTAQRYPLDLSLANGATHVSLIGTVQDPLSFKGANVLLTLAGDNMADLYPLTGIPIPATPKYRVTGRLAYAHQSIEFTNFHGLVGNSDLSGTIAEKPGAILTNGTSKPTVRMNLMSRRVDLVDLGGFIGTKAGGEHEAGATAAQRAKIAASEARSPNLLPDKPFNLPKLNAANIYLHYKADSIEGKSMPLDDLAVTMDIVNGTIHLHPISFGVGTGRIIGTIALTPVSNKLIHAVANVSFANVNVSKLMAATHMFRGAGLLQGKATLNATGNSIASWAGNGNGGLVLYMTGGNLSALLVSLSGLEFGNALIAALGLPEQTDIRCFVGDFALDRGIFDTRTLLLDTGTAVVRGEGTVNLKNERIDYRIQSKPKHFSIGSLPAPIDITGTMKKPSIGPAKKPLVERGIAVAVLGVIAAPLALLPTIQLGVKDPHTCQDLVTEAETQDRDDKPGQSVRPVAHAAPVRKVAARPPALHGNLTTSALNRQELKKVQHQRP
ncbi:AsmA family protein [Acidiphilium sp. AL]|uniref:AsmA family protein n=1 Tax=Acidiphilium sp. AL TaxID=2871704 RepID=UPI0021CAF558|nr:AsmA family protein [Acidiphilium sp. AL]MCU4160075.1 AsmA family protein [Acidiphilium sp. AL]